MTRSKFLPLSILVIGLSGCASTPDLSFPSLTSSNDPAETADTTDKMFDQITQKYNKWTSIIDNSDYMAKYSHKSYRSLMKQWEETKELYKQIQDKPEIVDEKTSLLSFSTYGERFDESVEELDKKYTSLNSVIEQAKTLIPAAIEEHSYLLDAKLDIKSPTEFQKISNLYQDLFNYISDGKSDKAKEYQTLYLERALAFEVNTAKTEYYVPLISKLTTYKSKGMNILAPQTFVLTESTVLNVEDEIKLDPRDKANIESKVAAAEFHLAHLEQMAKEVQILSNIKEGKFEPTLLEIENKLLKVSQEIDGKDFRDNQLTGQIDNILNSVKAMKRKINELETALEAASKVKMAEEKAKPEEVKPAEATPEEAKTEKVTPEEVKPEATVTETPAQK